MRPRRAVLRFIVALVNKLRRPLYLRAIPSARPHKRELVHLCTTDRTTGTQLTAMGWWRDCVVPVRYGVVFTKVGTPTSVPVYC